MPRDTKLATNSVGTERMVFVDLLRVVVIVMVIAHHAAQPYGPTGGAWPVSDPESLPWLGSFFLVNAAFGMGLLFLLAGYFVPGSYDRKGARRFLRDRWTRIGVPVALVALLVHAPIAYLLDPLRSSPGGFVRSLYGSGWQNLYVHLWFLGHLLLYSVGYVSWRIVTKGRENRTNRTESVPSHSHIIVFVLGLTLSTWVVRWWYPIDEWVPLLFIVAAEPAHLPQYVGLFLVGVLAYRGDWLRSLPTAVGAIWLGVGLISSVGVAALRFTDPALWSDVVALGGRNLPSLVYCLWEALICAGLSIGLITLFRSVFQRANRLLTAMSAASYAAYIVHLLIVIGLQVGVSGLEVPALMKFGLVTTFGVPLAFGVGHVSRWIPGVRVALGTSQKR